VVFLGSDTFSLAPVVRAAGNLVDGKVYFALWRNFDALTPDQQSFADRYKAKYSKDSGDYLFYHVLGYDGLMLAVEALAKSDGSPSSLQRALYGIKNFSGLSGSISIDTTGINRDPKSAMMMYENGKIVRYKPRNWDISQKPVWIVRSSLAHHPFVLSLLAWVLHYVPIEG
jgi:ABC-type branched-subunit amino acid transport system substrate-binding protein